jgi:glycosyltransferase involved in cell wall biosynthesis
MVMPDKNGNANAENPDGVNADPNGVRISVLQILEASIGGTATHLEQIATYIPQDKIKLSFIISPSRGGILSDKIKTILPDCEVVKIPMKRSISPFSDISALFSIIKEVKRIKPDIVHTHSSKAGALGRLASRICKVPHVVHTPHVFAMEWAKEGIRRSLYALLEKIFLRFTEKLILLHEGQRLMAYEELGSMSDKTVIIKNCVDVEKFYPASDEEKIDARKKFNFPRAMPIAGTVARLERQKDIFTFLESARIINKQYPRIFFAIAGDGALKNKLEKRAAEMGLSKVLKFVGEVDHMLEFYHMLDVFVLSSLWEGLPYSVLEAQACGLPAVATSTGGVSTIIDAGRTGTLVQPQNPEGLAAGISAYLNDKMLWERTGCRALENIHENFRIEKWKSELLSLYIFLVKEK